MYKKGEYVIYGSSGVCQVGDVTTLDIDNVPKDREYYVQKTLLRSYCAIDLACVSAFRMR